MASQQQQTSVAAILRSHPPQKWDTSDVKRWLESIGMDVYAPIFEATGVQGADLIHMDAEALKRRCGVSSLGHRTQLMSQIAVLSARANMSIKREGEKSALSKRKELLETLYPDKARRNTKAAMDEKLLEAREMYWTPDDRKERGAIEQNRAEKLAAGRGRPTSAQRQRPDQDFFVTEGIEATKQTRHEPLGVHRPPVNTIPSRRRVAPSSTSQPVRKAGSPTEGRMNNERKSLEFEAEAEEEEEMLNPAQHMQRVSEKIKELEESGNQDLDELVRAWVEYGACVRMEYGDKHPQLVRTHFYLATTYLRQKLVVQALQHFKTADSLNTQIGSEDPDSKNFHCRILEGMGICETRLGHFSAAQSILDKAKQLCLVTKDGVEESDGRVASVNVALSELHCAQHKYQEAIDCLTEAWEWKETELGPDHPQVGQLFNAMGTVKQKHLKELQQVLEDIELMLESSVRVKEQIDEKTEGLHLLGEQEEKGVEELVQDIANFREKRRDLEQELRICKADALDYLNRARKIITKAKGPNNPDAVSLTKIVSSLAGRFAEEEREAIAAKSKERVGPSSPERREMETNQWLQAQGVDIQAFGLAGNAQQSEVDELITTLKETASRKL